MDNKNCLCAIYYVARNHGRVFLAQMTSLVVRYDVIYHCFPINSQYLMTWGGGVDSPDHDIPEFCLSTTSGNHTINHFRCTGKTIHNQPGTVQYFHT